MTENQNATGSKKKLLVPLVALLMCAVAFTGAAYAYSSSITYSGNTATTDYLSIDLAHGGVTPTQDVVPDTAATFMFEDNFNYKADGFKYNTLICEVTETKIVYHLKITGDAESNKLKVSSSNIAGFLAETLGQKTMSQLVTVQIGLLPDKSDVQTLSANNTELTFDCDHDAGDETAQDVYVFFIPVAASITVVNDVKDGASGYATASGCADDVADFGFDLKFKAEQV